MSAARRSFQAIPLAAAMLAGAARAETRSTADIYVDAGYSSNPYLQTGDDTATASALVRLHPQVVMTGPTSEVTLSGDVDRTFYANRYNDVSNWSLDGRARLTLSPRSTLDLNASYLSRVSSALLTDAVNPLPSDPDSEPLPDPSAAELAGERSRTLVGGARFESALSARTTFGLSATATKSDNDSLQSTGYTSLGGSGNVLHTFSASFSGGATVSYTKTDYTLDDYGSASFVSPQLNAVARLSPTTTLSVNAGATFSSTDRPTGSTKQTSFSGSASLCRQSPRSSACIDAERATQATTQIGTSTTTSVSAFYSYRLTPRSSIRLSGQYSDTQSIAEFGGDQSRYGTVSGEYSRQISERLSFSLKAHYTKPFESVLARSDSFFGGLSLSYRFG